MMYPANHCGDNSLTDLVLAARYSDADGVGKACHYVARGPDIALEGESFRYRETDSIALRAGILRREHFGVARLEAALQDPATARAGDLSFLGIDEFNYCRDGHGHAASETLAPAPARLRPRTGNMPVITAKTFFGGSVISKSMPVRKAFENNRLVVSSDQDVGKAAYLWMKQKFSRQSLGLTDQSTLHFGMKHTLPQAQLAYEFPRMPEEEIGKRKKRTEAYLALWREIFETGHRNVHTVFVSHTLLRDALEDVGGGPGGGRYS